LLKRICGTKVSIATIVEDNSIHERSLYMTLDFPMLGPRLAQLQRFIESQDHKDPKQKGDQTRKAEWMAFWTLVAVGILSITLSIVQIAVAATQLLLQSQ
jgi:hypothetical protein